jgi:hypothetical protein
MFECCLARSYQLTGWEHELESHPLETSFTFQALGHSLTVKLTKNTGLFDPNYFEEVQEWSNGKLIGTTRTKLDAANDCHYQGHIEGYTNGYAAASTCSGGFSAYLRLSNEETLIMEPAHSSLSTSEMAPHVQSLSLSTHPRSLHVVYRTTDRTLPQGECAVGKAGNSAQGHKVISFRLLVSYAHSCLLPERMNRSYLYQHVTWLIMVIMFMIMKKKRMYMLIMILCKQQWMLLRVIVIQHHGNYWIPLLNDMLRHYLSMIKYDMMLMMAR